MYVRNDGVYVDLIGNFDVKHMETSGNITNFLITRQHIQEYFLFKLVAYEPYLSKIVLYEPLIFFFKMT